MQVRRISQLVLKREHDFIDTVGLGCVETPAKVYYNSGEKKINSALELLLQL
jgi:hypothetical protein